MSEPRLGRPPHGLRRLAARGVAAALVWLAAGLLPTWAWAKAGSAAPAAPASAASGPAAKTTLASIVEASAAQDAFEASVRQHLPGAARIDEVTAEVRAEERAFAELNRPVDASAAEFSERLVVFDRITRLRGLESRIGASAHQVAQWADRLDADPQSSPAGALMRTLTSGSSMNEASRSWRFGCSVHPWKPIWFVAEPVEDAGEKAAPLVRPVRSTTALVG